MPCGAKSRRDFRLVQIDHAHGVSPGIQRPITSRAVTGKKQDYPLCCSAPYNEGMARGWESKSVESQIESAETQVRTPFDEQISAEKLELLRKRETLNLSRTRVLRELETSQNPRYRNMMQKALTDLNSELRSLEGGVVHAATA
jgi:hypothetical protein